MSIALAIVSASLALAIAYSAGQKLTHRAAVVATYVRVGVREDQLNALALILLAAAAGLIAGLFWSPVGIAAAAGLVVYFVVAIAAHLSHDDAANAPTPVALEALAIATLVLHLIER